MAHNAEFDMKFTNYELKKLGFKTYDWDRVVDTLAIARSEFPGSRNNLDALCRRFNIDNSARTFHGALLDAELLAEVYLQLLGGDEPSIKFVNFSKKNSNTDDFNNKIEIKERCFNLSDDEEKEHIAFLQQNIKNSIWLEDEIKEDDKLS